MRVCILAMLLVACEQSIQSNPDLSIAVDLRAPDLAVVEHGCNALLQCELGCPQGMQSCNDACYDATSASGKTILQNLLDCLAGTCTTKTLDGGGTACSTAEGTALQDPRNAGTVQLSPACEDCARTSLQGTCHSQQTACLADKS